MQHAAELGYTGLAPTDESSFELGLLADMVYWYPFPGPGLVARTLDEVRPE